MSDTTEIQGLIDSGPGTVTLDAGRTYTLERAGTVSARITGSSDVNQPYALMLRSGVALDLNGARLRLADGQDCALVVNEGIHYQDAPDREIAIFNGTIDGNGTQQSAPDEGLANGVIFINVDGLVLDRLVFEDAFDVALRAQAVVNFDVGTMVSTSSRGDAYKLGIFSPSFAYDARVQGTFRHLEAHNCAGSTAVGNPLTLACVDSQVGRLVAGNCAGGFKVQDGSSRTTITSTLFDGGENGTSNSGLKLQGAPGAPVRGVVVGQVRSTGCAGPGLYIENAHGCAVFDYAGSGNAALGTHPDVWLGSGRRNWVGSVVSRGSGGPGVATRPGSYAARVERAAVIAQAGPAAVLQGIGSSIGTLST